MSKRGAERPVRGGTLVQLLTVLRAGVIPVAGHMTRLSIDDPAPRHHCRHWHHCYARRIERAGSNPPSDLDWPSTAKCWQYESCGKWQCGLSIRTGGPLNPKYPWRSPPAPRRPTATEW